MERVRIEGRHAAYVPDYHVEVQVVPGTAVYIKNGHGPMSFLLALTYEKARELAAVLQVAADELEATIAAAQGKS